MVAEHGCDSRERHDEMAEYMQTLSEQPAELSVEEQNLLLAAYKNAVGSRRGESDIITSVELPSCVSKDDLIYDSDLTKCRLKESSVWKKPKPGDEVKMYMKVTKLDGASMKSMSSSTLLTTVPWVSGRRPSTRPWAAC